MKRAGRRWKKWKRFFADQGNTNIVNAVFLASQSLLFLLTAGITVYTHITFTSYQQDMELSIQQVELDQKKIMLALSKEKEELEIEEQKYRMKTSGSGVSISGSLRTARIDRSTYLVRFEGRIVNELQRDTEVTWLRVQTFLGNATTSTGQFEHVNSPPNAFSRGGYSTSGHDEKLVGQPIVWQRATDQVDISDKSKYNGYEEAEMFSGARITRGELGTLTLGAKSASSLNIQWIVKAKRKAWLGVIVSTSTDGFAAGKPALHHTINVPLSSTIN